MNHQENEHPLLNGIAIMIGTIIGAGIFGIPYVVVQAGFLSGVLILAVVASAVTLLHLYIGEIVLSTDQLHQLTGYAEKYLGKTGKYLMFGSVLFGFYGALLAYIIGEGQALAALFGGSPLAFSLIFFAMASWLVYRGMAMVKRAELFMTFVILLIVFVIAIIGAPHLNWDYLKEFSLLKMLIPYGVIFFAIGGASAVPQLREILPGQGQQIKKAIIWGTGIPFLVYLLFTLMVIGISGTKVTEVATIGLGQAVGEAMIVFSNLFAFFAMATSFLTLGLALKSTYLYDFKLKKNLAWLLTVSVPLLIFLSGFHSFASVLGLAGAIGGSLEGLLILLIVRRLKGKRDRMPEYQMIKSDWFLIILSLFFIGGLAYTLWNL